MRRFFDYYISGLVLMVVAGKVGLKLYHGSAGWMLRNVKYLGEDYYPAITDQEIFDKAEEVWMSCAKSLGFVKELKSEQKI